MKVLGSRWLRPPAVLLTGLLAFSCSNEAFGPEVNDSPAVPPKVISVTPENGSVGIRATVQIEFSKSMNESSLRRATTLLEPATGAELDTLDCWLVEPDRRFWIVKGLHELDTQIPTYRVGQRYVLRIGNGAQDLYGNHLSTYIYEFTPAPYFDWTAIWSDVRDTEGTWDCWFNSPVDSSFYHYVEIDPPMEARWVGDESRGYHWWLFGTGLVDSIRYTMTILEGAHDRFGNPFQGTATVPLTSRTQPPHPGG